MRAGMGPSLMLKNLVSSEEDGTLSNHDRFSKTTNASEEKKLLSRIRGVEKANQRPKTAVLTLYTVILEKNPNFAK